MELINRCTSCGHLQHDGACYGPHEQEYRKRKSKLEHCGHETNFQIGDDHGNFHCLMCENNELRAALAKREKEYQVAYEVKVGPNDYDWVEKQLGPYSWDIVEDIADQGRLPTRRNVRIQQRFKASEWEDM